MGRPALVNGRCAVMRGQVQRAGGGLYYGAYEEFAETLTWLLAHPARGRTRSAAPAARTSSELRLAGDHGEVRALWPSASGRSDA